MVTYSIVFLFGPPPPPDTARVEFAQQADWISAELVSPKSVTFPVVARVIYSIILELVGEAGPPPIIKPLVELEVVPNLPLIVDNSPKCVASPLL